MTAEIINIYCYDFSSSSWRIVAENQTGTYYWLVENWIYPDPPHTIWDAVTIPCNAKKI